MRSTAVRTRLAAGLSLALIAGSAPAHASRLIQNTSTGRVTAGAAVACNDPGGFAHWTTNTVNWFHNTGNQGNAKQTALQNAMASWTNVANANHVLTYAGTTTAGFSTDGQNSIVWADGNGCTDANNCLALTALVLNAGQVIVESDITFNDAQPWRTNGFDFDTEAVAAHELGHSLGIHHTELTAAPLPSMATPYFGTGGRTLEADDRSALQCAQGRYCIPAVGAPPTPPSLNVVPAQCYGLNDLDWGAAAGATRYELYRVHEPHVLRPVARVQRDQPVRVRQRQPHHLLPRPRLQRVRLQLLPQRQPGRPLRQRLFLGFPGVVRGEAAARSLPFVARTAGSARPGAAAPAG